MKLTWSKFNLSWYKKRAKEIYKDHKIGENRHYGWSEGLSSKKIEFGPVMFLYNIEASVKIEIGPILLWGIQIEAYSGSSWKTSQVIKSDVKDLKEAKEIAQKHLDKILSKIR